MLRHASIRDRDHEPALDILHHEEVAARFGLDKVHQRSVLLNETQALRARTLDLFQCYPTLGYGPRGMSGEADEPLVRVDLEARAALSACAESRSQVLAAHRRAREI